MPASQFFKKNNKGEILPFSAVQTHPMGKLLLNTEKIFREENKKKQIENEDLCKVQAVFFILQLYLNKKQLFDKYAEQLQITDATRHALLANFPAAKSEEMLYKAAEMKSVVFSYINNCLESPNFVNAVTQLTGEALNKDEIKKVLVIATRYANIPSECSKKYAISLSLNSGTLVGGIGGMFTGVSLGGFATLGFFTGAGVGALAGLLIAFAVIKGVDMYYNYQRNMHEMQLKQLEHAHPFAIVMQEVMRNTLSPSEIEVEIDKFSQTISP